MSERCWPIAQVSCAGRSTTRESTESGTVSGIHDRVSSELLVFLRDFLYEAVYPHIVGKQRREMQRTRVLCVSGVQRDELEEIDPQLAA